MKIAVCLSLVASVAAFSQPEASRRDALAKAAAAAAAFVPVAANAAAGESPRFSVFGVIGDGTAYSEGAAYGTDQSAKVYSPYSPYGDGTDAIYNPNNSEYIARKKAIIAESKKRLTRLPGYIEDKKWYEVKNELSRYMYETRGAVRGLAQTKDQKAAATAFFKSIEQCNSFATLKKQDACAAAAKDSVAKLDAFTSLV